MEYGLLGLIVLIADIYALVKTWQSGASTGAKLLWTLLILVLPVLLFQLNIMPIGEILLERVVLAIRNLHFRVRAFRT